MTSYFNKNSNLKIGSILGLYFVAQALVLYNLGLYFDKNATLSIISILISIALIVFGVKQNKLNHETYQVMHALKAGISISIIGAVIYIAYSLLFIYNIAPNVIEESINQSRILLTEKGMAPEDVEKSVEMTRSAFIPSMILGILLFNVFLGFVVSLISGIFFKTRD
ncbi:DUF4199 domain-containing protein [Flavobacteriaceae bacterium]|nr:DUF4199 domain-containing protein [Flavobacteriaceae bacterium]